jgi:sterol desaturase/sphingolipid hydroxylase (fatty acid hydroxylase superfamily)
VLDLLPIILVAIYVFFVIAERIFPGRPLPKVNRWLAKGIFFFVLSFAIGGLLPMVWIPFFYEHRIVDLGMLGTPLGALVALIVSEGVTYVWHRGQHNVGWIWRWTHQMHHSAERVDTVGAFYFHPFDQLIYALLSSATGALLGVTPEAAALAGAIVFALACFQHANLRTPRWLGWLVQRPEAHAIHHQRGAHAFNYGNIALFDQLFGTYRNPATYGEEKAGFWDGASKEVVPMLFGRDVAEPRDEQGADPRIVTIAISSQDASAPPRA